MSSPSTERSIFMVEAVPVRRKRQRTAEWALTKSCGEGGARAGRGWGEGGARVGRGWGEDACMRAGGFGECKSVCVERCGGSGAFESSCTKRGRREVARR